MASSPTILSDKSISGDLKKARVTSRVKGWRDLDLSLTLHPIRKDIIPLKDDNAIKNSVKNLLISNFYERPFSRDVGANLRALLFEPADSITKIALKENIRRVIQKYEPRVALRDIEIKYQDDSNAYNITVIFKIKEFDTNESVEIVLRRLR
jgi:phage baseplate assembly protein W|tara:strand:- start:174 stop:629 length:456 start_codon:yes stop_codon:yes gene_type:complete